MGGSIMSSPLGFKPTLNVISAICGNFWVESHGSPSIYENLDVIPPADMTNNYVYGGYGLGQWTNKNGTLTRRTQLIQWLDAHNYSWADGEAQLEYLISENYWHNNVGSYLSLTDFLSSSSTNTTDLAYQYMRNWEGVRSFEETRKTYANKAYNYIDSHYDDPNITIWAKGNRWLSESEWKNNCVLIARWFWDDQTPPAPPDPPTPVIEISPEMLMAILTKRRHSFLK